MVLVFSNAGSMVPLAAELSTHCDGFSAVRPEWVLHGGGIWKLCAADALLQLRCVQQFHRFPSCKRSGLARRLGKLRSDREVQNLAEWMQADHAVSSACGTAKVNGRKRCRIKLRPGLCIWGKLERLQNGAPALPPLVQGPQAHRASKIRRTKLLPSIEVLGYAPAFRQ
jgi:hypothetical protein